MSGSLARLPRPSPSAYGFPHLWQPFFRAPVCTRAASGRHRWGRARERADRRSGPGATRGPVSGFRGLRQKADQGRGRLRMPPRRRRAPERRCGRCRGRDHREGGPGRYPVGYEFAKVLPDAPADADGPRIAALLRQTCPTAGCRAGQVCRRGAAIRRPPEAKRYPGRTHQRDTRLPLIPRLGPSAPPGNHPVLGRPPTESGPTLSRAIRQSSRTPCGGHPFRRAYQSGCAAGFARLRQPAAVGNQQLSWPAPRWQTPQHARTH